MRRQRFIWEEEYTCGHKAEFEYKFRMSGRCVECGAEWKSRRKWDLGKIELFNIETNGTISIVIKR